MEILLFTLDTFAFVLMVVMSVRDERRPAGRPATSLFRMRDPAPSPAATGDPVPGRVGRRR